MIVRWVVGWLLVLAVPVAAQQASVRVIDYATGRPLAGALISLRDPADRVLVRLLTDERGRALVTAPAPGRFRIRADAIGYTGRNSDQLDLGTAIRPVEFALETLPFELEEVVVSGGPPVCRIDAEQGTAVARLWDEAKKALAATSLTRANRAILFEIAVFDRQLDAGGRIIDEKRTQRSGPADRPFRAADPELLRRDGYVQERQDGVWYHGPDADLLLSEGFLADHCFRLARGTADTIGLAFEPADHRTLPDVRGTLWLRASTLEVSRLDFTFSAVDLPMEARGVGGQVEFAKTPAGGWYVADWRIKMPVVGAIKTPLSTRLVLRGYREAGGTARLLGATSAPVSRATTLVGRVVDSLARRPLSGVAVSLQAGAYADTTDADGRYQIAVTGTGSYLVTFRHPRLVALGLDSLLGSAFFARGATDTVDAGIPSERGLQALVCASPDTTTTTVIGIVRDGTGRPLVGTVAVEAAGFELRSYSRPSGTQVAVRKTSGVWEVDLDANGRFSLCGLPANQTITLTVRVAGHAPVVRRLTQEGIPRLLDLDLVIP
ncbi:MAG: carboxypeptidase regulatory-like domain-containing protein [Gemmatimonadales bacterium]